MDRLRDLGKSLDKKNKNDNLYDTEDMEILENLSGHPLVKNLKNTEIMLKTDKAPFGGEIELRNKIEERLRHQNESSI